MWRKGTIKLSDMTVCEFCVKYYNEASEDYGINGGKISKLMIKIDDEIVASYDRGWDISPADEKTINCYEILVARYN